MPNATHQKPNYGVTNTPYFSTPKWWEYLQIIAYSFTETLDTLPGITSFLSLRKVIISNSQFLCDFSSLVLEFRNFLKSAKPIHILWRSQLPACSRSLLSADLRHRPFFHFFLSQFRMLTICSVQSFCLQASFPEISPLYLSSAAKVYYKPERPQTI